jgi:chromosomal replication initiation ATPase DnaA
LSQSSRFLPAKPVTQGHLDFGPPSFAADDFVASAQNERARAALGTWQTWPGGVFCLFGEAASGKSHLGHIWAQVAGAPILHGETFDLATLSDLSVRHALIDRADLCEETALFSLLTALESAGGAVLLIARKPPSSWPFALPDLRSRLNAIACERLTPPEPELLAQLIIRHSAARGFKIDDAASTYLAARIPRTFEATAAIVTCMEDVARASLKSPMALAQRALAALYERQGVDEDVTTPDLFDH